MYFDTSYITKFYLDDAESAAIRSLAHDAETVHSSFWALVEFHSALHRRVREKVMSETTARLLGTRFEEHLDVQMWRLIPISQTLLIKTSEALVSAPTTLFLRAGDALHLTTARDAGETEIWTNDRHMLAAAPYFGLTGKSV